MAPSGVPLPGTCRQLVGLGGVEPPTSPLSGVRSNQLSYRPGFAHLRRSGLESLLTRGRGTNQFDSPASPALGRSRVTWTQQVTCVGTRARCLTRSFKGGDPAARSRTATLLRLHPSH